MITVSTKKGYSILAEVNPKTKRLFNFCIKGPGVDRRATYSYITEAERVVNYFTSQK